MEDEENIRWSIKNWIVIDVKSERGGLTGLISLIWMLTVCQYINGYQLNRSFTRMKALN
jgi:hypothetical protein